ncbi:MAG: histidine phosphatase family protein, partial [Alphaproteobacteria bacterium]|nr:histidine phosphatase family protein [Alphaproteobacteria bacterium]
MPRTPFVFLRHGRTAWNALGRAMGAADIPLDATGLAEAREAAAALPGLGITRTVASPLS